jgi:hypothetical protein
MDLQASHRAKEIANACYYCQLKCQSSIDFFIHHKIPDYPAENFIFFPEKSDGDATKFSRELKMEIV